MPRRQRTSVCIWPLCRSPCCRRWDYEPDIRLTSYEASAGRNPEDCGEHSGGAPDSGPVPQIKVPPSTTVFALAWLVLSRATLGKFGPHSDPGRTELVCSESRNRRIRGGFVDRGERCDLSVMSAYRAAGRPTSYRSPYQVRRCRTGTRLVARGRRPFEPRTEVLSPYPD